MMKSLVVKRSVVLEGHKTSVSLEDAFWSDLKQIARMQRATLSKVITEIDKGRQGNLSSAIRVFVFDQVRWRASCLPAHKRHRQIFTNQDSAADR
jgi:predicted DNA-binding ribbon-helix-helix protein